MEYKIEKILENKSITDYLQSRNILPSGKQSNGKIKYKCPIHNDLDPSFVVYDDTPQNFYCYGCGAGGNIIHLVKKLENKSTKDVIISLSSDLNISLDGEIDFLLKSFEEKYQDLSLHNYITFNIFLNDFLSSVSFNTDDYQRIEIFCQNYVDNDIDNFKDLSIYEEIEPRLEFRRKKFNKE